MDKDLVTHWFSNHPAIPGQREKYERLWAAAREFAKTWNDLVPETGDTGVDKRGCLSLVRQVVTSGITAMALCQCAPKKENDGD